MTVTIKTEGFKELEKVLGELGARTGKAVMRRALIEAAEPMARIARVLAPKGGDLDLSEAIGVGTRLTKRQGKLHRRMFKSDKASAEVFVGVGGIDPAAWAQEFGNILHGAQPFMRPAFERDHMALLKRLRVDLADQINKAVARASVRAGRAAR